MIEFAFYCLLFTLFVEKCVLQIFCGGVFFISKLVYPSWEAQRTLSSETTLDHFFRNSGKYRGKIHITAPQKYLL